MRPSGVAFSGSIVLESSDDGSSAAALRTRAIFRDHFDFIWRLLSRLGVPHDEVDDAAQQVFIVATKRLGNIAEGSERSFLYGTAIRTAATFRRNAARRNKWLGRFRSHPRSSSPTPYEQMEKREALALLDEALGKLHPDLQRVFILSDIEGLPVSEVASLEKIPAGTVASRLRRARQAFLEDVRDIEARATVEP